MTERSSRHLSDIVAVQRAKARLDEYSKRPKTPKGKTPRNQVKRVKPYTLRMETNGPGLYVKIMCAEDLLARDLLTGKSDPICFVTCGAETKSTSVKHATISPIWNEEIEFRKFHDVADLMKQTITIEVKDEDMETSSLSTNVIQYEDLGKVDILLSDYIGGRCTRCKPKWFALGPTNCLKKVYGRLMCCFRLVGHNSLDVQTSLSQKVEAFETEREDQIDTSICSNTYSLILESPFVEVENKLLLHISIIKGKNFDCGENSKLFCQLICGDQKYETAMISLQSTICWEEETFVFGNKVSIDKNNELIVLVKEQKFEKSRSHEDIGELVLSLLKLDNVEDRWYPLSRDGKQIPGEISLQYSFKMQSSNQNPNANMSREISTTTCDSFNGIPRKLSKDPGCCLGSIRTASLYKNEWPKCTCVLNYSKQIRSTSVSKKTLNPEWNERFSFSLGMGNGNLTVFVRDQDTTVIGKAVILISKVNPETSHFGNYPLHSLKTNSLIPQCTGEICIEWRISRQQRSLKSNKKFLSMDTLESCDVVLDSSQTHTDPLNVSNILFDKDQGESHTCLHVGMVDDSNRENSRKAHHKSKNSLSKQEEKTILKDKGISIDAYQRDSCKLRARTANLMPPIDQRNTILELLEKLHISSSQNVSHNDSKCLLRDSDWISLREIIRASKPMHINVLLTEFLRVKVFSRRVILPLFIILIESHPKTCALHFSKLLNYLIETVKERDDGLLIHCSNLTSSFTVHLLPHLLSSVEQAFRQLTLPLFDMLGDTNYCNGASFCLFSVAYPLERPYLYLKSFSIYITYFIKDLLLDIESKDVTYMTFTLQILEKVVENLIDSLSQGFHEIYNGFVSSMESILFGLFKIAKENKKSMILLNIMQLLIRLLECPSMNEILKKYRCLVSDILILVKENENCKGTDRVSSVLQSFAQLVPTTMATDPTKAIEIKSKRVKDHMKEESKEETQEFVPTYQVKNDINELIMNPSCAPQINDSITDKINQGHSEKEKNGTSLHHLENEVAYEMEGNGDESLPPLDSEQDKNINSLENNSCKILKKNMSMKEMAKNRDQRPSVKSELSRYRQTKRSLSFHNIDCTPVEKVDGCRDRKQIEMVLYNIEKMIEKFMKNSIGSRMHPYLKGIHEAISKGHLDNAYRIALNAEDPDLLLVLMDTTTPCLEKLDRTTVSSLLLLFLQLLKKQSHLHVILPWIRHAIIYGLFKDVQPQLGMSIQMALFNLASLPNEDGFFCARLYYDMKQTNS